MSTTIDRATQALDEYLAKKAKAYQLANEEFGENGDIGLLEPGLSPTDPDIFREEPVPLDVFVSDKLYLGQPALSDEQRKAVELGSAIYFPETYTLLQQWKNIRDPWWNPRYTELAFMWGKGSGKDYCCRLICARVAYLLLCLKDPQAYYNMGPDDSIDILNVARSSNQAAKVFFIPLARIIRRSPWFSDKADVKTGFIEYENNVQSHSGHADQESLEGFNLLLGIADEIAAFKTADELRARPTPRPGQHSADAISEMMRSSGQSRFPGIAKVVYISYPRFRGDFMTQKIEQAVSEPTMYGTTKATWEVNPTRKREHFDDEYRKNPEDAAAKYECKPPHATNKYFRNDKKVDAAFVSTASPPIDDLGYLMPDTAFEHGKIMAGHLDLALTNDRAAICLAHMQDWSIRHTADGHILRQPIVFIDIITSFSAQELGRSELDMGELEDYVLECKRRGGKIRLVTADQFQSRYMLQNLQKQGIECRQRSVDRDTSAYDVLKSVIYQGRFVCYERERVKTELKSLQLLNGVKIDHMPGGSKDEADALAGAVAGVVELAFDALEAEIKGAKLDWANPETEWHDPIRGQDPWSRRAQFSTYR